MQAKLKAVSIWLL